MTLNEDFLLAAKDEIEQAWIQIDEHAVDGEDNFLSIADSFPHGIQDPAFVIFQKARRVIGYEKAKNYRKVREELQDIINYAAFGLALLRVEEDAVTIYRYTDEGTKEVVSRITPNGRLDPNFIQDAIHIHRSGNEDSTHPTDTPSHGG